MRNICSSLLWTWKRPMMMMKSWFCFILVGLVFSAHERRSACLLLLTGLGPLLLRCRTELRAGMSGSSPPPPSEDAVGSAGCFPPGYKPFNPEEHGLDRGFRLTSFSDMKGWGCKVPQEALLKLLSGLEPDRADGSGKAEDQASEFAEQLSGPRLGEERTVWVFELEPLYPELTSVS